MKEKAKSGLKIICNNRKAKFNYFFKEFFEAGIALKGSEVKSLRGGKANISESYAIDNQGEIFLVNSHIPSYKESVIQNKNFAYHLNCFSSQFWYSLDPVDSASFYGSKKSLF